MSLLRVSELLLALSIFLQTIELLQLRSFWSDSGTWRWATLQGDFARAPRWVGQGLGLFLGDSGFTALLWMRLLAAVALAFGVFGAWMLAILFLSTWLIAIRWRGTFNGGSDSMTALVALSLWIAESFSSAPWVTRACFGYIAVQLTASYFVAGWVKLRNPLWRSGQALPVFFKTPGYDSPPQWVLQIMEKPAWAFLASASVIGFECAFPLAWLSPKICLVFLTLAFGFHLLNFWIFGLNRFVFSWLAAYPALYFWSQTR